MKPYYQDGWVTLYHGDAREVVPQLSDAAFDFIFTDPPYGHNNNNGDLAHRREAALGVLPPGAAAPEGRPIANDGPEANELVLWFFGETKRLLRHGGCCCCCCGGGGPGGLCAVLLLTWPPLLFPAALVVSAVAIRQTRRTLRTQAGAEAPAPLTNGDSS